ncbi:uncharacterized protein LOC118669438 [Myotis myotis]|uniref:uncharacterized protein LOC118669438 n=1 Tax=Myotis myotis TaxID=51298 RepID=UPI00174A9E58|nr:uncharacterized protein LOC118669438 [Myotis myotis]
MLCPLALGKGKRAAGAGSALTRRGFRGKGAAGTGGFVRGDQRGRGTRIRTGRVLKGRTEAAALLLLTSERGLESLPRLKPDPVPGPERPACGLTAPGLGAAEPRDGEGTRVARDLAKLPCALQLPDASAERRASWPGRVGPGPRKTFLFPTLSFGFVSSSSSSGACRPQRESQQVAGVHLLTHLGKRLQQREVKKETTLLNPTFSPPKATSPTESPGFQPQPNGAARRPPERRCSDGKNPIHF